MSDDRIVCVIYRSRRKRETYLYLPEGAQVADVPEELQRLLGPLDEVMTLELTPQRKLARAEVGEVMAALREQGYYLQLPPPLPLL